ncbi:MAG: right-handed parallel beta-helix repeat-containing protein [Clostridiales Family XIII bacterium]|jgi:hypothetical protein|nr:right-handed parallel beta-helix repeat-containing protein [Clostridiales Family XIII bacterium]
MKQISHVTALALVLVLCFTSFILPDFASAAPPNGTVIYVAPDGNDNNAGTNVDQPLATVAGARDRIRAIKKAASGELPPGGITVYFRGGTYNVAETTYFEAEDTGTAISPITYTAYPGEKPLFSGGSYLDGKNFSKVSDPAMLSRLMTSDARKAVVSIDLFKNGFTFDDLDYSKAFWANGNLNEFVSEQYAETGYMPSRMQVFIDDQVLDLARYPNKVPGIFAENPYDSYLRVPEVLDTGFDDLTEQPTGKNPVFRTLENRVKRWASYEDIVVFGSIGWEFFYNKNIIKNLDPNRMTIELKGKPSSGVKKGSRYAFENVFEELDTPGEYYISREGVLYLFPTKNMKNATVKISMLDENYMVDVKDSSYLTFSELGFELTKGSVFHIVGGEYCNVEDCTLKNYGGSGVRIGSGAWATRDLAAAYTELRNEQIEAGKSPAEADAILDAMLIDPESDFNREAALNGKHHSITGSTFLNTGFMAAKISTGNTVQREGGDVLFENNIIKHSGILGGAYNSGLNLEGVGITIKNNLFSYCRGQAISANIIDTKIIYNEFVDSPCDMAEDTGAVYINYMGINDGTEVRYNYFHDVTGIDHPGIGFDFARRVGGAYYDNNMPHRDFSYNVIYNVPLVSNPADVIGLFTNVNNIYVDVPYVFEYPTEDIRDSLHGQDATGMDLIQEHDVLKIYYDDGSGIYNSALWLEKYPTLKEYYDHMEVRTNIETVMSDIEDNLVVNLNALRSERSLWVAGDWKDHWQGIEWPAMDESVPVDDKYGKVFNNHYFEGGSAGKTAEAAALFSDYEGRNFELTEQAAEDLGIQAIDMSKIGVQGIKSPKRVNDFDDPLSGVKFTAYFDNWFRGTDEERNETGYFKQVSLWREVTPGNWEWVNESGLNVESSARILVKPGADYAVYFHGDSTHFPQFVGVPTDMGDNGNVELIGKSVNIPAEVFTAPPKGVTKFRVKASSFVDFDYTLSSYENIGGKVLAPVGKALPADTYVEVRRLATAPDGHLYWDFLPGTFPVDSKGKFTIENLAPRWKYAIVAHAQGYEPTWLGDVAAADFAPANPKVVTFTAPANNVSYKPPTITLIASEEPEILPTFTIMRHFGLYSGSGVSWAKVDHDHQKFLRLLYNGEAVDPSQYSVSEGSTVITLEEAHVKSYASGTHYFTAVFTDGQTDPIKLEISKADGAKADPKSENNSKTGDDANIALILILIAAALCALCATLIWRKKTKRAQTQ